MIAEYEDLYSFCKGLFGSRNVSCQNYRNPDAIEIEVILNQVSGTKIKSISLNLYRSKPLQSFMHVNGDFTFEYGEKEDHAINEMKKYLKAAANNKLTIKRKKIFGLTVSKRLMIDEPG